MTRKTSRNVQRGVTREVIGRAIDETRVKEFIHYYLTLPADVRDDAFNVLQERQPKREGHDHPEATPAR